MNCTDLHIDKSHVHKLLLTANSDAAVLYLYVHSGNDPERALEELKFTETRYNVASATLRQLGLWPEPKKTLVVGERPQYTETDVIRAADTDGDFRQLCGEVERQLGRALNTEEQKILLGFIRYLGLPLDVIFVLVCYCKERARQKGSHRAPTLRAIEKEAYFWADQGIDTMEEASAFIQHQNMRNSRLGKLLQILQIRGRNLTAGEEKYAYKWMDMGFGDDVIALAYERTCINTGGLSWAYMNRILLRWHEAGLTTLEKIQQGDKKPAPKGATGELGQAEMEAIQKLLREG